jgi:hypothetical protein
MGECWIVTGAGLLIRLPTPLSTMSQVTRKFILTFFLHSYSYSSFIYLRYL